MAFSFYIKIFIDTARNANVFLSGPTQRLFRPRVFARRGDDLRSASSSVIYLPLSDHCSLDGYGDDDITSGVL